MIPEIYIYDQINQSFIFVPLYLIVETGNDVNLATIQHLHPLPSAGPTLTPSVSTSPALSPTNFGAGAQGISQFCSICGDRATGQSWIVKYFGEFVQSFQQTDFSDSQFVSQFSQL